MQPEASLATDADIYREHSAALTGFATVLVGPDYALDVVSSAVLRALGAPGWASVVNRRAYLYQAVANEARNFNRGQRRRREREASVAQTEIVYPAEAYPEVLRAVRHLSVRQRAVVYLTYWEDMTDHMIADYVEWLISLQHSTNGEGTT